MKFFIIAGEASGDLHGANLMKQIKLLEPSSSFKGFGGNLMKAQGLDLVKHINDLAFMGFVEVLANIRTILKNFRICEQALLEFKPDAIILLDYPGFNLKMAKFAHQHNIKVYYYISPQLWAWKEGRVQTIKKYVTKLYVILPFEKDFYSKYNYQAEYVGHPLLDAIQDFKLNKETEIKSTNPIIAILPGSRMQEIKNVLPTLLELTKNFPNYTFVIGKAPSILMETLQQYTNGYKNVSITEIGTYNLLSQAHAALVTSGTATLETALFKVPQIVCYKGSSISIWLARKLVGNRIKFISLVNLIMNFECVKELIQQDFNIENLTSELKLIAENGPARQNILKQYDTLIETLGKSGASLKTATSILNNLKA